MIILSEFQDNPDIKSISLNIDDYIKVIDQILFSLYYLGTETITLFSNNKFPKDIKATIREKVSKMSGTEITFEDDSKITIKVLLDKSKININQVIYRIYLIIDSSLINIENSTGLSEIRLNEAEIDRLYHLIAKIISLSLSDQNVLNSCGIKNISLVLPYFLMSKKLENIADNILHMGEYMSKKKIEIKKEIINDIREELKRCIHYLLKKSNKFQKIDSKSVDKIRKKISSIGSNKIEHYLHDILRYVLDIGDEIVNISFYTYINENSI